mmetsp:Transcript_69555/g.149918  ORF Transcript_69555/g.149918 Transcript_69555/m.149918 type:complete len:103 (+) Transcript_69555:555-863(+)|eukprot:CAMPEP_0116907392 /NCGR_PEP_ID=MMETSP0467-20121206/13087_1 /TAXON_ID=283647 /ORGANISM="Mesodinium pulex, Strain SPMC105" /LENGTH=102 /DNA_ID=CAMNT_0004582419 /DNA_START=540 /DNA_END=848 /DNA_ORIENTATION=+
MLSDDSEQLIFTLVDLALRNILTTSFQVWRDNEKKFVEVYNRFRQKRQEKESIDDKCVTKKFEKLYNEVGNLIESSMRTNRKAASIAYSDSLNQWLNEVQRE